MTIQELGRRFGLSRSTLLYYDRIGLLSPSQRSAANYRIYSQDDVQRMEMIQVYRQAGLPLKDVARVLSSDLSSGDALGRLLETRLRALAVELQQLRRQQAQILHLLKGQVDLRQTRFLDKEGWVAILRATGLDEEDMRRWHVEFENVSPAAHQDFLESLGLGEEEIRRIRTASRSGTLES